MPNKCLMCSLTFNDENDLTNHECKSESKQQLCSVSSMPFLAVNEIKKCDSSQSDRKLYSNYHKKSRCLKKYDSEYSRIKTSKRSHLKIDFIMRKYRYLNVQKSAIHSKVATKFFCNICLRGYNFESSWKKHLHLHHTTGGYRCKFCKKRFISYSILTFHRRNHKQFSCDLCQKVFIIKESLQAHRKIHLNGKIFACDKCDLRFSMKNYLTKHYQIHIQGKYRDKSQKFPCTICGRNFSSDYGLRMHFATHTGERIFDCKDCDSKFKSGSNLNHHRKLKHSDLRPHRCFQCNISCLRRGDLKKHYATPRHQNKIKQILESSQNPEKEVANDPEAMKLIQVQKVTERKHRCEDCNLSYSKAAHLKRHLLSLTHKIKIGEIQLKNQTLRCMDCDISFTCTSNFKQHLKSRKHLIRVEEIKSGVAKEDSYETLLAQRKDRCNICNMTFVSAGCLDKHFETLKHKTKLEELETGITNKPPKKINFCSDCNLTFLNSYRLQRHFGTQKHKNKVEELKASGINVKEEIDDPEEILPD